MKTETNRQRNHRYYLHHRVRQFTILRTNVKEIEITETLLSQLSKRQKAYLSELKSMGYSLQFVIE